MEYRSKNRDSDLTNKMTYEDNILLWKDAIDDKIRKTQDIKSQFYTFYHNQSIIGIAPILGDSKSLLDKLVQKEWYLPFIEKMNESRQREWLSVRVLLKELLGGEKQILYHSLGNPYISDNSYHISISHTKTTKANQDKMPLGYVAVILNKEKAVAIDIERISSRIEKIRSRFVNEEEEKALSKKNEQVHLLLHWSAKESIFKLLETENVEFKSQLHICPFEPLIHEWSDFQAYETCTKTQRRVTVNYFVHDDYVLTYI